MGASDAMAAALTVVQTRWERSEWAAVLGGMVATWRDAFERVPADSRERALATVAQDPDRGPMQAELEAIVRPVRAGVG